MGLVSKNPVLWVCDEVLFKPAQLQRLARIVKFFMYQVSLFYFSESDNKGTDQTVQIYRLVCAFIVCMQQSGFLVTMSIYVYLHFRSNPLMNL